MVVLVGLGVVFGLLPALALKADIMALSQEAQGIPEGIQNQNLNQSIEKLATTKKFLDQLTADYRKLSWLKVVPVARSYYRDGERVTNGGRYLLEAGEECEDGNIVDRDGCSSACSLEIPIVTLVSTPPYGNLPLTATITST